MDHTTEDTLSEEDKHANYKMLIDALSEKNPTPEWIENHGNFIVSAREFFKSFNHVFIVSEDPIVIARLKENGRRCEILIQNLISSISTTGTYDLTVYRLFAENLEPLVRQYVPEDDLAELLGKMQM